MQELINLVRKNLDYKLTERQIAQFNIYLEFLLEFNSHTNLTRIDPKDIPLLHFYDSLTAMQFVDFLKVKSLIDIGTGAGFPGVPLKILFPHLHLSLVDSRRKKVAFLEQLAAKLKIENVACVHARAEDLAKEKKYRGAFDIVTARAVAEVKELLGLLAPFKNPKGKIILYKGPKAAGELESAKKELSKRKVQAEEHSFDLADGGPARTLIILS